MLRYKHVSKCDKSDSCKCKDCLAARRLAYNRSLGGVITNVYFRTKDKADFDKPALASWIRAHRDTGRIFADWAASGYAKRLAPSLRRIDTSRPFSFNNMILGTQGGVGAASSVVQIDAQGEILQTYSNALHASRCTGASEAEILGAVAGLRMDAGGWLWVAAEQFRKK